MNLTPDMIHLLWCINGVFVVMQINYLVLIALEPPGFLDNHGIIRYISDGIRDHNGFGAAMLISFCASVTVLCICRLPKRKHEIFRGWLKGSLVWGGIGVIGFHDTGHYLHLTHAGIFITSGLLLHLMHTPFQVPHVVRDNLKFYILFVLSVTFLILFFALPMSIQEPKVHWNGNESHRLRWTFSALFEYLLYVTICALNSCAVSRVVYWSQKNINLEDKPTYDCVIDTILMFLPFLAIGLTLLIMNLSV